MKRVFLLFSLVLLVGVLMALDRPLGYLQDATIYCSETAATPIQAAGTRADSIYIANSTSTCVHVGGSGVTTSTGVKIGNGCRDGVGVSVDAKKAWCIAENGSDAGITVDTVFGVQ